MDLGYALAPGAGEHFVVLNFKLYPVSNIDVLIEKGIDMGACLHCLSTGSVTITVIILIHDSYLEFFGVIFVLYIFFGQIG